MCEPSFCHLNSFSSSRQTYSVAVFLICVLLAHHPYTLLQHCVQECLSWLLTLLCYSCGRSFNITSCKLASQLSGLTSVEIKVIIAVGVK